MANLRLITPADAERVKYLAYAFHEESPYRNVMPDEYKVGALISEFIYPVVQGNPKVCILLEEDNKVVGVIAGTSQPMLFSQKTIASEIIWYILPRYRGGTGAIRLRKAFEYWAENVAMSNFTHMASLNNEYAEKLQKHYEKKGYQLSEMTYLKENTKWQQ